MAMDAIQREIFKHLFAAIPEEMGAVLQRSSFSPNIKERKDFSCGLFNANGDLIAQAAHIPVHLGAMPLSVKAAINSTTIEPGDMVILNDPYRGGTHLPDITLIAPIFISDNLVGFVANRAHHADVGGMAPGSMPIARELIQEGLILPPVHLIKGYQVQDDVYQIILRNNRTPIERAGDLKAQIAANLRGVARSEVLIDKYGTTNFLAYSEALLDHTEKMTRTLLRGIPDGVYTFEDMLDDDGLGHKDLVIKVEIHIQEDQATIDFSGTAPQAPGSVNAVFAITLSAVHYVIRCLLAAEVPNNAGVLRCIQVIAPEGCLLNAVSPAPVAGGNVETSQRIVDVLLGAMANALPMRIPAASQGTMNNTLIGGWDPFRNRSFTYYETIAGGMGAGKGYPGTSGMHSHMTNTLNTPAEALEYAYPLQVTRYQFREKKSESKRWSGGVGIQRDLLILSPATASLLSERRAYPPYGLAGGDHGEPGENILIRDGKEIVLPSKGPVDLIPGDILSIRTPGGGSWGNSRDEKE